MKRLSVIVLVLAALLIAASAIAAALGLGNGTILLISVASMATKVVAMLTGTKFMYAFHHYYAFVFAVFAAINIVLFLIPAVLALVVLRRKPAASYGIAAIWCTFYVACLFVLFPLTRS
jgi:hypothetical protein